MDGRPVLLPRMGKSKRDAFDYWERKMKDDASNPRVHRNLAPMYLEQAQLGNPEAYPTAIKHLKAAVHFDPSNDQSRNDFALALLRAGRLDQAIEQFKIGLTCDPRSPSLHKNLSAAYARRGKYKYALEHAHEAVRLDPNDPMAHRNIARILDTVGNTRDSLSHNRAALKLGPGALTGGVVRDSADTDTYRVVARQTVARQEYSNGRGSTEQHYDAYRGLAGKRFTLPFSETTRELLEKAGIDH